MRERAEKQPWQWRPDLAFRWVSLHVLSSGCEREFHTVWLERKKSQSRSRCLMLTEKVTTFFFLVHHITVQRISAFLDTDLWLQPVELNSVDVEQSGADFSVSWWQLNVPWRQALVPVPSKDFPDPWVWVWLMHSHPLTQMHKQRKHTCTQRPFHSLCGNKMIHHTLQIKKSPCLLCNLRDIYQRITYMVLC